MSHPIESFGFTEEQAAEIVGLYNGILWRADQHPNSYRKVLLLALQSPAEMVMDRTTLGPNILPLERDGLVAVEQGSRDRRSKELRVTAAGEARFRAGMKGWVQAQRQFEKAFGANRTTDMRAIVHAVTAIELGTQATG